MNPKQQPLALVASATRLVSQKLTGNRITSPEWQADAWNLYDLVGEQRFLANTLANRLGQARLYVGILPDEKTGTPDEVMIPEDADASASVDIDPNATANRTSALDPGDLINILAGFGGTPAGRNQIITRMGLNLFVAGECWLAGLPQGLIDRDPDYEVSEDIAVDELVWRVFSTSEVSSTMANKVKLSLGESDQIEVDPDDIFLIRIWRSHPNKAWEADSPVRSSMPVLRELVGLSMHTSAQVDSRLAGAGILLVPQSAQRAMRVAAGLSPEPMEGEEDIDPFTEALIEAMTTPINDRSNASAVVPLVVVAPDEVVDKFKHISFATPLDEKVSEQVDKSLRRLALGEDCPPELLLGLGTMNHWGAWLVQEDVVETHIEPSLALICDSLTSQYLWPVMEAMGYDEDEIKRHVIWYDVEHMIVRPNKGTEALAMFDKGLLSPQSTRAANGFDDSDAPASEVAEPSQEEGDEKELRKQAGMKSIELAIANPQLVIQPGLQALAQQLFDVLSGNFDESDDEEAKEAATVAPEPEEAPEEEPEEEIPNAGPPNTAGAPAEPEKVPA